MSIGSFNQMSRQQKSLLIIIVGAAVILLLRFGGWMVIARSLRWLLPLVVIYIVWKRISRR
jgi:hypothetical protein